MAERKGINHNCPYYLNPYHKCDEYCVDNILVEIHDLGDKPVQNKGLKKERKKSLTPTSFNKTNFIHKYTRNFLCINPVGYQERIKGIPDVTDRSSVHPKCKFASNPYHKCTDYCFESIPVRKQIEGDVIKTMEGNILSEENVLALLSERNVRCQFSTNPCHVCSEYCFQIVTEREKHRNVIKLNSPKESKKIFSNECTSVHPPRKFTSNSYHERVASYIQNELDQNIVTKSEGSEKSPVGKRTNHSLMEKICIDSDCTEALNSGTNIESHKGIILHEDTKKSSMNLQFVELSSPDYNHVEFSKRIITVDGNNDLCSEMMNPKEYSDVQPLHIDAHFFFIEWAKYCSQEKADEYKVIMQDKTVNEDKENAYLKYQDSSKLQKIKAQGSFQSFLPTSLLLFFVGFLFTLFYWTQIFHPVVSEKKMSTEGVVRSYGTQMQKKNYMINAVDIASKE